MSKTSPGEEIHKRFIREAAAEMQAAIADACGHEVFFAGALNDHGVVVTIRVLARGNEGAVNAIFTGLGLRDVVIHNHPSGNLTPSDADLDLSHAYGANGHGVYIVDNEATRVYVVIEPFLPGDAKRLDVNNLDRFFQLGGPLSKTLNKYEPRKQQAQMAGAVARAFNHDGMAVIEAPTGVGKTMAYLLPAVTWALENRERVVISTRTINLQEQIIQKDIPQLKRALGIDFEACLVKGRQNYVCMRKVDRAFSEASLFDDKEQKEQLDTLSDWLENTTDGSRSDLPFVPGRELWESVCSEADSCSISRCPDKQRCFLGKARRAVAKADILVVNHHMLFSDLAVKMETGDFSAMAVLPAYGRLIFDEAHSIEDSATEYLGVAASQAGALAILGHIQRVERGRERGLIPMLLARIIKDCPQVSVDQFERMQDVCQKGLLPALAVAREGFKTVFTDLRDLASKKSGQIGREIKWRLTEQELRDPELRTLHKDVVIPAVGHVRDLLRHMNALYEQLEEIKPTPEQREAPVASELLQLGAYMHRLERITNALAECTSEELEENTVRWIEIDARNPNAVRAVRCPLEVGKPLAEWLYDNMKTIVMTSATLAVNQDFKFLFSRLGLSLVNQARMETVVLDTPYNFQTQALLGVPRDMPEPNDPRFAGAVVECISDFLRVTRGHAFVLFTAYSALDHAFQKLAPELERAGVTALKQGNATRTQLLERFRSDTSSVLFATDSFWEGVDVVGDALQCVILARLPFRVPTEPVLQARTELIEQQGGNAFTQYSVPQAVIKFRQGFGRLIRSRNDRGVVLVLDPRILTKPYGRQFLRSLPPLRVVGTPRQQLLTELNAFFNPEGTPDDHANTP